MKKPSTGTIVKVSGPLVIASGMRDAEMFDVVRVSDHKLIGEIIEMHDDQASIQVYEETAGLGPGESVVSEGAPLSVELGPGLIGQIFDGIQRPLDRLVELAGNNIARGVSSPAIDRDRIWNFQPVVKVGDRVSAGDVVGEVEETVLVNHRIMVPVGVEGEVAEITGGEHKVTDVVARIKLVDGSMHDLTLIQKWPVRRGRPYKEKIAPTEPLVTGQRSIDTFFPVARGGTATIPGPFGSGKTVVQHQLAKWAASDIVVYIGCGERGNEMTDVLMEFPELIDPKSGQPLMARTILIANTSDMPVAAREASIYTGITIAEYYRDMGYSVSIMADSTSRWAEALREMSGRLEEMPGEEGYPAYLGSRLANFYERAGQVRCLGSDDRIGVLTAIGAVSPPGGDLSDPVVQSTLRIVKVFWGLDSTLAYKRHFPAINWLNSYSLYADVIDEYMNENVIANWSKLRADALRLLQEEAELEEIVRLIGQDSLSQIDRLKLEASRSLREDYLAQDSFDVIDTYTSPQKMQLMLNLVMNYYYEGTKAIQQGVSFRDLDKLPVRDRIARIKGIPEDRIETAAVEIGEALKAEISALLPEGVI
ncbi:MAG: V-type ATP synthase subunit A [Ruminococcaceae bacterium]|nr:V-type ATP synthase subunit A [Oscillospiraceae bacterium]